VIFTQEEAEEVLAHYGVRGMRWGVHQARVDARKAARARMAYGEGAGTQRKLIKARVESRKAANPDYAAAFDRFMSEQNMGRLASGAKVRHRTKTAYKGTTKTARGVYRQLTGGFGSVSLASAAIAGAYVAARQTGADKVLISRAQRLINNQTTKSSAKSWLRTNGFNV
jgi:hypothetical protein